MSDRRFDRLRAAVTRAPQAGGGRATSEPALDAGTVGRAVVLMSILYARIRHGDEAHQRWLKDELLKFARGPEFSRAFGRATVSEWRSGLAADWTGHMLRCARINGRWSCDPRCPSQRLAALEGALRGARQRVDEYDNRLCWCRHLRMFADSLHDHGCRSARAALAPPERSRVAAAPEPPGADDTPRGA